MSKRKSVSANDIISYEDAAEALRCSVRWIQKLIKASQLERGSIRRTVAITSVSSRKQDIKSGKITVGRPKKERKK